MSRDFVLARTVEVLNQDVEHTKLSKHFGKCISILLRRNYQTNP